MLVNLLMHICVTRPQRIIHGYSLTLAARINCRKYHICAPIHLDQYLYLHKWRQQKIHNAVCGKIRRWEIKWLTKKKKSITNYIDVLPFMVLWSDHFRVNELPNENTNDVWSHLHATPNDWAKYPYSWWLIYYWISYTLFGRISRLLYPDFPQAQTVAYVDK